MKRHTLSVCSALAVILGLAACSKSELSSPAGVAESTPMVFTASGLNPAASASFAAANPAAAATLADVDDNYTVDNAPCRTAL